MGIPRQGFLSIDQLTDRYLGDVKKDVAKNGSAPSLEEASFQKVFEQKKQAAEGLHFSKHAAGRLLDRGIQISDNQMERLYEGVRKAQMKGISDSLVIVDELAFIVNVPNQTVVTAMTGTDAREKIFTNINGAVIN